MGPQNLNNYYFNKLDARLDYSSYYDIFLASDEWDYNREVVFSPYLICVIEHLNNYLSGNTWCSDCLPLWIDLSNPASTRQLHPYLCTEYDENNTLLSLPYWCSSTPTEVDTKCRCPKCENQDYTGYTEFVESICDVGLTGVDNGLVQYMSGNTTEFDVCKLSLVKVSAFTSTITGVTGTYCQPIDITLGINTPLQVINDIYSYNLLVEYPCSGPKVPLYENGIVVTGSSTVNNFKLVRSGMAYSGCCNFIAESGYTFTISDVNIILSSTTQNNGIFTGKTTIDYGYWEAPCKVESLKIWTEMPEIYKWDHLHYDRRFKMKQVTGLSQHYSYGIESVSGETEGYYNNLRGGFYQGFYELYGYPYQVLPERVECGWTIESLLKFEQACPPLTECIIPGTKILNDVYPNNEGIYFYMGTRAENKFHNFYSAETNLITCQQNDYSCEGIPTQIITTATTDHCGNITHIITSTYDEKIDSLSNAFALRLTEEGRVGYRALYYTGSCVTTYSDKKVLDCDTGEYYVIDDCVTGLTYTSGYTIVEKYSDIVCGLTGETFFNSCPWLLVSARFQRDYCYDGCDLLNMGGVNDLINIPILDTAGYIDSGLGNTTATLVREAPLMPGFNDEGNKVVVSGQYIGDTEVKPTACTSGCTSSSCIVCGPGSGCTTNYTKLVEEILFSKIWSDEKFLRTGTLTIFVNGRPVLTDPDFEEIIPRRLNTEKQKQVGVPFNISWGGGTQGLIDNQTFSADTSGNTITCPPYVQDPNDLGLLIEKNFAGTYMGGISQLRYYIRPLGVDEIFHNFLVNKDRYDLVDCAGGCTNGCGPCPAIIIRDCDSLDIILDFAVGQDVTSVDSLAQFIVPPEYVSARFTGVLVDNVISYTITVIENMGVGPSNVVTTPFLAGPTDIIKVDIVKFDNTKESKVTIIGNLTK